jgi:hypothetical protein
MPPGQSQPNELEKAILERIAHDEPWLVFPVGGLRVLSREFTGVGGYTTFVGDLPERTDDPHPGLKPLIRLPAVPNGMGAVLWCRANRPSCLELFTYGEDRWDGTYEGFSLYEETGA